MAETFKERAQRNAGFVRFLVFLAIFFAQCVVFVLLMNLYPYLTIVFYFPPLLLLVLSVMAVPAWLVARRVLRAPPPSQAAEEAT